MEPQIKAALISLLDGIKRTDGQLITSEMAKLDELLAQSRAAGTLHPQLEHFLAKRSYAKALMFLGGETDIPAGASGGRPAKGERGGERKSSYGGRREPPPESLRRAAGSEYRRRKTGDGKDFQHGAGKKGGG